MTLAEMDLESLTAAWKIISDHGTEFGEDHYNHVFSEYPEIKKLFFATPEIQGKRLTYALNKMIVNYQENREEVVKYIKLLGRQHRGFKAKRSHYPIISSSLIRAGLNKLPEEHHEIWKCFINEVSEIMEKNM